MAGTRRLARAAAAAVVVLLLGRHQTVVEGVLPYPGVAEGMHHPGVAEGVQHSEAPVALEEAEEAEQRSLTMMARAQHQSRTMAVGGPQHSMSLKASVWVSAWAWEAD